MRFLALSALLFFFQPIFADFVSTKDGDALKGNILYLKKDKLGMQTDSMGIVDIDWNKVDSLTTNKTTPIKLKDGQIYYGILDLKEKDHKMTITTQDKGSDTGSIKIKKEQVIAIKDVSDYSTKWSGQIGAGGSFVSGNADTAAVNGAFNANLDIYKREKMANQLQTSGSYNFSRSNGKTNVTQGQVRVKFLTYITPRWDWFLFEQINFNRQQKLTLRANEQVGVDWHAIITPLFTWTFDIALARLDSFYNSATNRHDGFFGFSPSEHLKWNMWNFLILSNDTIWTADFGNPLNYILETMSKLTVPVGSKWALEFRHTLIYTSKPPNKIKRADNVIVFNILYVF